jgi:hypothetical protein
VSESKSPLARLVVFMVCLSIARVLGAGIHGYAVNRQSPDAVRVPTNEVNIYCMNDCQFDAEWCSNTCGLPGDPDFGSCSDRCLNELETCETRCGF